MQNEAYLYAIKDLIGDYSNWPDKTEMQEPRIWVTLPKGRTLEIVHEEFELSEDEYYYSWNIHRAENEKDSGEKCGIITWKDSLDFEDDTVIALLDWAFREAEEAA